MKDNTKISVISAKFLKEFEAYKQIFDLQVQRGEMTGSFIEYLMDGIVNGGVFSDGATFDPEFLKQVVSYVQGLETGLTAVVRDGHIRVHDTRQTGAKLYDDQGNEISTNRNGWYWR